jgi:hypothetical protein
MNKAWLRSAVAVRALALGAPPADAKHDGNEKPRERRQQGGDR